MPILVVLSLFHPSKTRAVEPLTAVTGVIIGSLGCGAYLYYRALRRELNKQDRLEQVAQVLMALRGSQNLELHVLLKEALKTHFGDFAKLESLFINQYHDDPSLIARLRWQLPLLESRRKPDLLAWLEFDELASAREAWKQLQLDGWRMHYVDPNGPLVAGDGMFSIYGPKRRLTFCTPPI